MMEEMDHGSVLCERYVYIHVKFFLKRTRTKKHIEHMCVCVCFTPVFLYLLLTPTCCIIMREKNYYFFNSE